MIRNAPPYQLVVLISGHGSNLQAILDACASGELNACVAAVISNQADAFGLERARRARVPVVYCPKRPAHACRDYDARLANLVAAFEPDWVVLAGWMRLLTSVFLDCFPGRVVNLHPALPSAFTGTHAIERALDAFRRGEIEHTGVMVHLVPDEGVDSGPVLAQAVVEIHPEDDLPALEARVHAVEHELLVATLGQLCDHRFSKIENGQKCAGGSDASRSILLSGPFKEDK
jgi:phosphoribosylglycinamide formyltransferase-1